MDGKTLTRMLAETLNEDPDTSGFVREGSRVAYDLLYQSAVEFNARTKALKDTQSITTVEDEDEYTLDADFQQLYVKDSYKRFFVRYTDDDDEETNIFYKDEEDVVYDNNTTSIAVPPYFYIKDKILTTATRTGTATSAGDASAGQCILTDTSATFTTHDVWPGDTIHNTTDGSTGYVLSVTSETALVCALFDGTGNDWDTSDDYVIVHQPRLKLVLSQPCETADETITVPFIQRPAPVYSDYGTYRFQMQYAPALVKYAAWLLKYRDRAPDTGNAWFQVFERAVNQANMTLRGTFKRRGFTVSMKRM